MSFNLLGAKNTSTRPRDDDKSSDVFSRSDLTRLVRPLPTMDARLSTEPPPPPQRGVYHQSNRGGLAGRVGGDDFNDNLKGDDDINNIQPSVPHTTINL